MSTPVTIPPSFPFDRLLACALQESNDPLTTLITHIQCALLRDRSALPSIMDILPAVMAVPRMLFGAIRFSSSFISISAVKLMK